MTTPLLTTKLFIPPPPESLVPRPSLLERLTVGVRRQSGGFARKLTLISASAGFRYRRLSSSSNSTSHRRALIFRLFSGRALFLLSDISSPAPWLVQQLGADLRVNLTPVSTFSGIRRIYSGSIQVDDVNLMDTTEKILQRIALVFTPTLTHRIPLFEYLWTRTRKRDSQASHRPILAARPVDQSARPRHAIDFSQSYPS